jgi:hypothetical protein
MARGARLRCLAGAIGLWNLNPHPWKGAAPAFVASVFCIAETD